MYTLIQVFCGLVDEKKLREIVGISEKMCNFAVQNHNLGEMAEWSIAAVLKTVEGHTSGGSNPSLSANSKYKSAVNQIFAADLIFNTYKYPYNL